jgi:hypothetical protein
MTYVVLAGKNPVYSKDDNSEITLQVDFEGFPEEFVPFTARKEGGAEHEADIFARAETGEFGEVAAFFEAELPTPKFSSLVEPSVETLLQILLEKGVLTDEEIDDILVTQQVPVGTEDHDEKLEAFFKSRAAN